MVYRFDEYVLDSDKYSLSVKGEALNLEPRVLELLHCLIRERQRVVSKDELIEEVWGGAFVSESALKRAVHVARRAIADDGVRQRLIRTVHARGYRFVGEVEEAEGAVAIDGGRRELGKAARQRRSIWIAAPLLLLCLFEVWRDPVVAPAKANGPVLAVIPFENLGPAEVSYLSSGVSMDLSARLASVRRLSIVSCSGVTDRTLSAKTLRRIRRDLGAEYLLSGSIFWLPETGDRLSLISRLVDTGSGKALWNGEYQTTLRDLLIVQSEIVEKVADKLKVSVIDSQDAIQSRAPTKNQTAYQVYLRGLEGARFFGADPQGSVRGLELATRLDPGFALAWAGLSEAHSLVYHKSLDRSPQRLRRAQQAAETAVRINPDLPQAHAALGYYYYTIGDFGRASEQYALGSRGYDDSKIRARIAWIQRRRGRFADAIENLKRAAMLDPREAEHPLVIGQTLIILRRFAEADVFLDRALLLHPGFNEALGWKAVGIGLRDRSPDRALEILDRADGRNPFIRYCRWWLLETHRRYAEIVDFIDRDADPIDFQFGYYPGSLVRGLALYYQGSAHAAKDLSQARERLLEELRLRPDDQRLHRSLSLALAGLGAKLGALGESDGGDGAELDSMAYTSLMTRAQVLAMVGEPEAALDLLDRLTAVPSEITVNWLSLSPRWDSLRQQPRFQRLLSRQGETVDTAP